MTNTTGSLYERFGGAEGATIGDTHLDQATDCLDRCYTPRTRRKPLVTILDPTDERTPIRRALTARPEAISGSVALLDISKPRGDVLIARLEERLAARLPGVTFRRYAKPTFTKPAPEDLRRRIAEECNFVIEALAD